MQVKNQGQVPRTQYPVPTHSVNLIVTGASGFIGGALLPALLVARHEVTLLTRKPDAVQSKVDPRVKVELWDGETVGTWSRVVDGADAVVNLAGESIGNKRWTREQKDRIINSRVKATNAIVAAIRNAPNKPSTLINASAVGFYGHVEDGDVAEDHPRGRDFLSETVTLWEGSARKAEEVGVRVILLRTAVVLGKGGALPRIALPFRLFVGGPLGSGRQGFPWVHIDDLVGVILFALDHRNLLGPVNVAAPQAVTMKEFCAELGKVLHRPSWAPVPGFVLKTALGEMSAMVLTGQRAVPRVLERLGYEFKFPDLTSALTDVLR